MMRADSSRLLVRHRSGCALSQVGTGRCSDAHDVARRVLEVVYVFFHPHATQHRALLVASKTTDLEATRGRRREQL